MKAYRKEVRRDYASLLQEPIAHMLSNNPEPCATLQQVLMGYMRLLTDHKIITVDCGSDQMLPDLHKIIDAHVESSGNKTILFGHSRCNRNCHICRCYDFGSVVLNILSKTFRGREGMCGLCCDCFLGGKFALALECAAHG